MAEDQQVDVAGHVAGWQVCAGCALELPKSSAFFPGLGDRCRLCRASAKGDKVVGMPAPPEPQPEGVPA